MVEELALASSTIVSRVYSAFDEVFRDAVNDERTGWLVAIFKGAGVLGFQLAYIENGMDVNRTGKAEGEGHGRRLRDDRKGAKFLLR